MTRLDLTEHDGEADLEASFGGWLDRTAWARGGRSDSAAVAAGLWHSADEAFSLADLIMPVDAGGQGAELRYAARTVMAAGTALAPLPLPQRCGLAPRLLGDLGRHDGVVRGLLGRRAALATIVSQTDLITADHFAASIMRRDGKVFGTVSGVVAAGDCTDLIVPVSSSTGPALVLFGRRDTEIEVVEQVSLDTSRPISTVSFRGAEGRVLIEGEPASDLLNEGLLVCLALQASEQYAIARVCLEETLRYVTQRHQFGRPIGSFQAVKHRLAQLWIDVSSAAAAGRAAIAAVETKTPDRSQIVQAAAVYTSDAAVAAAEERLQFHGGLGMTWEDRTHRYLKRAKSSQLSFGGPGGLTQQIATLAGIPAPAPLH